jgi:hypothetical protein
VSIATNAALSDLTPRQSTLINDVGDSLPIDRLKISNTPGGGGRAKVLENAGTVYLVVDPAFQIPGKFVGTVSLSSAEKADLGSFGVSVASTSTDYQLLGLAALFVGLVTYFCIAVWAKGRSRQILAALPAARLRDEVTQLVLIAKDAETKTKYTFKTLLAPAGNPGSLLDVLAQLDPQALKKNGFLPWTIGVPFASQDLSTSYQSFLLVTAARVSSFTLVVRWGLTTVVAMWPQVLKSSVQPAGQNALKLLDGLVDTSMGPPDSLRPQIQSTISALQTAITAANPALGGGASSGGYGISGTQQLTVELERLSAFVWILWAVLTLFVGSCTLIWFNDGFGTSQDLVKCFLWGVGMPAVAGGFGALSASSVTSAFSLQTAR